MNKKTLIVLLVVCVLAYLTLELFSGNEKQDTQRRVTNLPWQITAHGKTVLHVFGIDIGKSTLSQAAGELGSDYELAWFLNADESISLEAYFQRVSLAGLEAKMILEVDAQGLEKDFLHQRSGKPEILPSKSIKYPLASLTTEFSDRKVKSITYIPKTNLDKNRVKGLFGEPGEVLPVDENSEHWIYPDRGLSILLNQEGREVFQYVPLEDIQRLKKQISLIENRTVSQ